jgi:signal transduction histidine kinase
MGPDTEEEHREIKKKLTGVSLDAKLEEDMLGKVELRTSPSLEGRFKSYEIPLVVPSRFKSSYDTGSSFFGIDGEGYQVTEVDKKISEIFGTDNYALITVKGRGGKVIGWFYADFKFSGGDLSILSKEGIQPIEVITSSKLQTIRDYENRLENEKLALLGRLVATLVHEARNPLTTIGGFANHLSKKKEQYLQENDLQLLKNKVQEDLDKYLPPTIEEVARLERAVGQISDFSIPELNPTYSVVNLYDLLEEAVKIANGRGQKYVIKKIGEIKIKTDPSFFKVVAINLANNAFEAIRRDGNRGELVVSVTTDYAFAYTKFHNPQYIPPVVCKNIFDPFYSTKTTESTGLGLTIAQRCAYAIGGRLLLNTDPQKGTTFTLKSPLYRE